MRCPYCGEIVEEYLYCTNCGAELDEDEYNEDEFNENEDDY